MAKKKNKWSAPKRIPLSAVKATDAKLGGRRGRYRANDPIYVKKGLFGGYTVHDGNRRVLRARQAGKGSILAHVKQ